MNSPPETLMIVCAAISADRERVLPALRHGADRGPVLHPDLEPDRAPRAGDFDRPHRHRAGQRLPAADRVPGPGAVRAARLVERLAVLAAGDGELLDHAVGQERGALRGDLDLALHRLVPALAGSLGGPPLDLQEPQDDLDDGLPGVLKNALGLGIGALRGVGGGVPGRHHHAELPAALVLLRRGPVRVQDVPLVQDGVGDAPDGVEVHGGLAPVHGSLACASAGPSGSGAVPDAGGGSSAPPAAASSAVKVASQVGRACRAL